MARIDFTNGQGDVCPVCFLSNSPLEPDERTAAALVLGCVSAVVAESPLELGELIASACSPHQQRMARYVHAFSGLAGADYTTVFEKLGARPAGPPPGTVVHLVTGGHRTLCGSRDINDPWPDNERFVYIEKIRVANCPECLRRHAP